MTSYFDEDILSEDNNFETDSTTSSNDEKDYSNNKSNNKNKKLVINKKESLDPDPDLDPDADPDADADLDPDADLDDDDDDQFGGAEDFPDDDEPEEIIDDDEDPDQDQDQEELNTNTNTNTKKIIKPLPDNDNTNANINIDTEYEEEENMDGLYLKKFDKEINNNYIMNFHPECIMHNYDEVEALTKVVRNKDNIIIDDLHKTIPYLTKYERTRILGQRAKQINAGAIAFVKVPENVIDGYLIAELELKEKRIPFIIRRPLPNGGSEYWNIKDLENIGF